MEAYASRRPFIGVLAGMFLMGALAAPRPAAAHCGEHADSCGPSDWEEVSGGYCEDALDPYEYGTWIQPYEVSATWCNRPVACVSTITCNPNAPNPCSGGLVCPRTGPAAGTCCPPGMLAPCAECAQDCTYDSSLPFEDDTRCWPWGIEENVPCAGPMTGGEWRNHGGYVSAVAHLLNGALDDGLITEVQHEDLMEAAGASTCGK